MGLMDYLGGDRSRRTLFGGSAHLPGVDSGGCAESTDSIQGRRMLNSWAGIRKASKAYAERHGAGDYIKDGHEGFGAKLHGTPTQVGGRAFFVESVKSLSGTRERDYLVVAMTRKGNTFRYPFNAYERPTVFNTVEDALTARDGIARVELLLCDDKA